VLLGKQTEKVGQHGHADLSVFGIGKDHDAKTWRSVVRQLIVGNFIRSDAERYGAIVLTENSRAVLRGEREIRFRMEPKRATGVSRPARSKPAVREADQELWEALRECRQALASEHAVPPYVIFHDKTLVEMLESRPRTEAELLDISGIGQAKLERYGAHFLAVLNENRDSADVANAG